MPREMGVATLQPAPGVQAGLCRLSAGRGVSIEATVVSEGRLGGSPDRNAQVGLVQSVENNPRRGHVPAACALYHRREADQLGRAQGAMDKREQMLEVFQVRRVSTDLRISRLFVLEQRCEFFLSMIRHRLCLGSAVCRSPSPLGRSCGSFDIHSFGKFQETVGL